MNATNAGLLLTLSLLAGCVSGDRLEDARFATGSSTITTNARFDQLFVVNTDAGSVSSTAPNSTAVDELPVGIEPTRIARAGDRLFVTLRGERAVAMIALTDAGPVLDEKIPVGAEPFGVVASEDGSRVYVSVSQGNQVVELNGTGRLLRTWDIPGEPRYLALHPSGKHLYVASTRGAGKLWDLDLTEGKDENVSVEVPLPTIVRLDEGGRPIEITGRITGDMSVNSDGDELVVPVVYVDNKNPVEDPELEGGVVVAPVQDGYGSEGGGIDRFNPGVVVVGVAAGGEADSEDASVVFVSGFQEDVGNNGGLRTVRSYPSSVTIAPDGITYYVTFEGSDSVAVVGKLPFQNNQNVDFGFDGARPEPGFDDFCCDEGGSRLPFTSMEEAGFVQHPKMFVRTAGWAPAGVAFLSETDAWVHESMSRAVSNLPDADRSKDFVRNSGVNGFDDISFESTSARSPALAAQVLPTDVFEGRRLFYSATNTSMAASGAGVSCATCHTDGRNDGLTWTFDSGLRQTPSLAGQVSLTAPVTWTSNVASVAHEAQITTEARMGGDGLNQVQLDQIAAFVDWTRHVDSPMRGETSDAIVRGKAIFERADVACASCHSGEALTDNRSYTMFDLNDVNTPTLVGIAGSGPYLHDGRASTLRDVLDWSRTGAMGNTSMLSEAEMNDLEAYLHSL